MNSIIQKLYDINNGGALSLEECQIVNESLSALSMEDIPSIQRENVESYLTNSLNLNSVEPHLIEKLEHLLKQLQKSA